MPIEAVTLDAFGTLFDIEVVTLPAVESVIEGLGLRLDAETLARTWTGRFHALHQSCALEGAAGFRTIRKITEASLGETLRQLGSTGDVVRGTEIWFRYVAKSPLYPEVREAVARLGEHFRLAVITDTDDDYFGRVWQKSGLGLALSDGLVFTSSSARNYKLSPGGLLFRRAFRALGARPEEVAHVGDMPTDVLGATAAGAKAVWLSRDGRGWTDGPCRPAMIAHDLAEAAEMLVGGWEPCVGQSQKNG